MPHPHLSPPASPQAGSVLAIGGVARVPPFLDPTPLRLEVYQVEKRAATCGVMAHTDKTFPSTDRSPCILTQKKYARKRCAVLSSAYRPQPI